MARPSLPASGKPAYLGMWTWLVQRLASLALLVLLPWHWLNPYLRPVRIAVLALVLLHAMAGIRVMLLDLGFGERWQRGLVWLLAALGAGLFFFFVQFA
ncbi:MAG: hypothetical protein KatS3mg131_3148 [Candidatus Tectimicrobiota bacterium]|nr:MAG: hypothetical protein KatS3mg131_3148 [Candidatus Tectomicrobia bacterium]